MNGCCRICPQVLPPTQQGPSHSLKAIMKIKISEYSYNLCKALDYIGYAVTLPSGANTYLIRRLNCNVKSITFSFFKKPVKVEGCISRDVFRLVSQHFPYQPLKDGAKSTRNSQVCVGERYSHPLSDHVVLQQESVIQRF